LAKGAFKGARFCAEVNEPDILLVEVVKEPKPRADVFAKEPYVLPIELRSSFGIAGLALLAAASGIGNPFVLQDAARG